MKIFIALTGKGELLEVEPEGRITMYDGVTVGSDGRVCAAKAGDTVIGRAIGEAFPDGVLPVWNEQEA